MKKIIFSFLMSLGTLLTFARTYVDLGLPSHTRWATTNENGLYTYDQAMNNFGQNIPSKVQWEELMDYCNWKWTGRGYKIIGPNNNSIFLPAEGRRKCDGTLYNDYTKGYYWTSTLEESDSTDEPVEDAYHFSFTFDWFNTSDQDRCEGHSIRLIQY